MFSVDFLNAIQTCGSIQFGPGFVTKENEIGIDIWS